jgi:predicted metallo-beta-lactamase superfamily hydrolase
VNILNEPIPNTKFIKIYPVAGESFGVRSFCFRITTPDTSILLDPGCALGPRKGSKVPHPLEFIQLRKFTESIINAARKSSYLFISHFHHDHFKPNLNDNYFIYTNSDIFKAIFDNKQIYSKNHFSKINKNQQKRG